MSDLSRKIREQFQKGDDIRDAGLTAPDDVACVRDIVYGESKKWQSLDVYRPKADEGKVLPVIVSVHGGAWVYGDKERYQYYCMSLAQRGFAVVNFTYRLAPENKFPAPIEDTNMVFSWVLENAKEYGFDVKHVFAVGDSAGAQILGLYCAICTNPEYAKEYAFTVPAGFCPSAVALNCGKYRILLKDVQPEQVLAEYLPEKGTEEEINKICVINHVTSDFPPTFLMTAAGDFLSHEAPVMAESLITCGVPFEFHFYSSPEYTLGHVFHCNMKMSEAKQCNDDECTFFRKFL